MNHKPTREETIRDHQERLNRVLAHIQQNLDGPLSLDALAGIACFSPFHFHRLFAAFVGEPLWAHVRRLRLERAAVRLARTQDPVTDIALAAGYETPSAFTKAFAQHFDQSPTDFRKTQAAGLEFPASRLVLSTIKEVVMNPEIRTCSERKVIFVRRTGNYGASAQAAWAAVCGFAFPKRLVGRGAEFIGVSHDDPAITPEEKLRYDACITIEKDVKPEGEVGVQTIAGGKYAVFLHKGPFERLGETYGAIYRQWLPSSGEKLREMPCFELYLNDPERTRPENLKTEIFIPIE